MGKWPADVPKLKTLDQMFKEFGGYEIETTVKGKELVGLTYDGPFDELEAQQRKGGLAFPEDIIPPAQKDWTCSARAHVVIDPRQG